MVGLFERKRREWRDDDYVFLEDLKKEKPVVDTSRFEEAPEYEDDFKVIRPPHNRHSSVKERLEKLHRQEHDSIVKKRLENLQVTPSSAPKPLNDKFFNEMVTPVERKVEMPDNAILKRVETAIKKIEQLKQKMTKSNTFLSLFYDLKKAEKEFLAVMDEAKTEMVEFPSHLEMKITAIRSNIRTVK